MNKLNRPDGFKGGFHTDKTTCLMYATDASSFQETPLAVAIPEDDDDIKSLILFAAESGVGLIPRTAGTSLAGQVVGSGIVVDVSKHFGRIQEIDQENQTVVVQPGVIRNELNMALKPHGLYFGPETSTQNRAMIGGMLGNNSCGSNSLVYGSTRDHTVEVSGFLSNGDYVTFSELTNDAFERKCGGPRDLLESQIYNGMRTLLSDANHQKSIREGFPHPEIKRRNTGYALDALLDCRVFAPDSECPFNFCKLIAGSEGTLFFATRITLRCQSLPPQHGALLCAHFESIDKALHANLIALKHSPYASELIDHHILDCTKRSIEHRKNRFFVEGEPNAILVIELRGSTESFVDHEINTLIRELRSEHLGYHFPILKGEDMNRIWELRKAGLGLLSNTPGDDKPVPVIEDGAVRPEDLPNYVREVHQLIEEAFQTELVYYAHAGSGELHIRPILNLKTSDGKKKFREIAEAVAKLLKKYRGSLSGEHGDGRLRGEFISTVVGEENDALFRDVKRIWDPKGIFNPNKIVGSPPMNESLRYTPGQKTPEFTTYLRFEQTGGYLRTAELCNGSGDCRKTQLSGGTMCPSYMATRDEKDTTRARANVLRSILTNSNKQNPFDDDSIKEVMDLCLSCKGCKSECPSNVDMAKLKAEFLQHYYDSNGVPMRSLIISRYALQARICSKIAPVFNTVMNHKWLGHLLKKSIGFAPERSIPALEMASLKSLKLHEPMEHPVRQIFFFCDEFTEYADRSIGEKAIRLLERLGYEVIIPTHSESGRSSLSKGLLKRAKKFANRNVTHLSSLITRDTPLVGVEPSAILSFRDEYPDLVSEELKGKAEALGQHCFTMEEFLASEWEAGRIDPHVFKDEKKKILLHGHCQQKAIGSLQSTEMVLQIPRNYEVAIIPSGCCGMAGSFGYEKEHYELSMKIGEMVLFPAVRKAAETTVIVAPGTSCRHQIKDGTHREAYHPVEILYDALV